MPRLIKGPDGVVRSFPDDATDDEIRSAMGGDQSQTRPSVSSIIQKSVVPVASTVGGMVGGVVGGVPGAAVGGAAGEGIGQLTAHLSELAPAIKDVAANLVAHPRETAGGFLSGAAQGAKDMGVEGAVNATGEGVGQGVAKLAWKVAPMLMEHATNAPLSLAREFPDLSQTMVDNALTISKGGLEQARTLLKTAKATANGALDDAAAKGATVPVAAATAGLQKTFDEQALNSSDPVGSLSKLASLEKKITAGRNSVLTMQEADALKTSLQNDARTLYKSMQAGNGSKAVALEAVAKADMAAALNQAIEDATTKVGVAGYKAANASAQDLIGATRAISRRILQSPNGALQKTVTDLATPATLGGVIGGGPGAVAVGAGSLAARAMTAPSNLSRTAIFLSNPTVQGFLRQLPVPIVQAIYGATGGSSTETPK